MLFSKLRLAVVLALGALTLGAAACQESLDSGAACPSLCPLGNEALRDTVLNPVAFDTVLAGFPQLGVTRALLLATAPAPDSVDVRAVVRFDSLPTKFAPPAGGDSVAITTIDSTYLRLRLDTTGTRFTSDIVLQAYDVDTPSGSDTSAAALAPLFTAARLIGALAIPNGTTLTDSLRVPISKTAFAAKIAAGARLRVGLRLVSAARAQLRILPSRVSGTVSSTGPGLTFDPSVDTVYRPIAVIPAADTTKFGSAAVASALVDQSLVVVTPRGATAGDLIVGGAPGRRSYIRFNVPINLTDSTDVVRAVLELTQRPVRYLGAADSVTVRSEAVLATTAVTDLVASVALAAPAGLSADTLRASPADSAVRTFSIVTLVRAWRALPANTQRAVALRTVLEGAQTGELRFFSAEAPAAVRPRLRLTYIPRTSFGIP